MQAITGHWPNFIREVQSQVLGDDGFGNSFDWGRARGRDFHGLASIVYLIDQLPAHRVPPTAQTMEKWLTRTTPVPPKLRTGVLDTFRVYLSLTREKAYKKAFTRRVSPIEFVMIGVMIYMKRAMLSLTQLSHAVDKMRTDVRSVEKDVRTNGRVSKLLFRFILEKLPRLVLRSDGKGDKRPHLPSLLNQHHMLQLLQHLRNPRLTLNLDVHRQQKSASIKRRKMTRTVVIPPIPKMGTMMTSTFPQGENHQASLSPKSPVYSQQQNVVRVRVILGQQLRCPPRLLLV